MKLLSKLKEKKILVIILSVTLVLLIGCAAYIGINVSKIWGELDFDESAAATDEYEEDPEASGLPEIVIDEPAPSAFAQPTIEKTEEMVDILLLGVDNRNRSHFSGRSDVIMYLRIDTKSQSVKLVSFMRDTLVKMKGHNDNKLNTAYRFGSTKLAKKTMNENFGLMPDHYIVVNFYGMEDIINSLGGVDIDIEKRELKYLNVSIDEINSIDKKNKSAHVSKHGLQHLNGRQAVAYMRIRHIGNGDRQRIKRQQTVMSELFKKLKKVGIGELPGLISTCVEYVRTDIPLSRIIEIAKSVKEMELDEFQKFSYPHNYITGSYNGMSVVKARNRNEEIERLKNFMDN